ncbi:SHOCT domain-containing protein [Listeria aquatica]
MGRIYTPPTATNSYSAADELKKFKELLNLNIITQSEFDTKKKELLDL